MTATIERRYPGHQRDIGHTLQITLSSLLRAPVDPESGDQRFADPEDLQLAGGLLRELQTAVAFCTMAEKECWYDELPTNLKPLCQKLAFTLTSLGAIDEGAVVDEDLDDEDDDELSDVDEDAPAPERALTLPELAGLVDEDLRNWAQSLNVLLPQFA